MTHGSPGAVALTLLTLVLSACASLEPRLEKHDFATFIQSASDHPATWLGLPLTSGQILVSDGMGPQSLLFTLMLEQFHPFVHAGVIVMEGGMPYVYHATAGLGFHFSGPPTDAMRGSIRRSAFDDYLRTTGIVAVYDPPSDVDSAKVAAFARHHHAQGTRFDPYFNPDRRDEFYCAEFVARAMEAGGAQPVARALIRNNPSLRVLLDWLRIQSVEAIPADALTHPGRHISTLSLRYSPAQVQAYPELKRELHRRFTREQKLGNVFYWSVFRLGLRKPVQQFMTDGLRAYAGQDMSSGPPIPERVRAMASETLGSMDEVALRLFGGECVICR